jgi:hypothetical protein
MLETIPNRQLVTKAEPTIIRSDADNVWPVEGVDRTIVRRIDAAMEDSRT